MPIPRPHRAAAAAVVVALAAGCGSQGVQAGAPRAGHEHGEHGAEPVAGAREVRVVAEGSSFAPPTITLAAGETVNVVLDNVDPLHHDIALTEADFLLGADGGATASAALTVAEPGSYEAICSVPGHAEAGMVLTVQVDAAAAEDGG